MNEDQLYDYMHKNIKKDKAQAIQHMWQFLTRVPQHPYHPVNIDYASKWIAKWNAGDHHPKDIGDPYPGFLEMKKHYLDSLQEEDNEGAFMDQGYLNRAELNYQVGGRIHRDVNRKHVGY